MEWTYYQDGKLKSRKDDGVPVGKDVLVVDNSDPFTAVKGEWGTAGSGEGHEGFDYRTHNAGSGEDTFTWQVDVPRNGRYEVFVRYASTATAKNAAYQVEHDGGTETKVVDQTQQQGEWVSLGSYGYTEDAVKAITLSDKANGTVVADAIKLVRDGTGEVDNEQKQFGFVYDANDNLREMTDSSPAAKVSRYLIDYTQLNQIRRVDEVGAATRSTSYTYDADGNIRTRDHNVQSASFEYDVRGLLQKVTNTDKTPGAKPQVALFEHDERGQIAKETKANGNTVVHDYFLDTQRKHYVERKPDNTIVSEHTLEYDANGHRTKDIAKTMNADNHSAYLDHVLSYEFDPVSRLRKAVKSDLSGKALETESYVHDANGNVVEQVVDDKTTKYTYDRNRLVSSATGGVTATNAYDSFGRLDKITAAGKLVEKYRYDGFDRIIEHQKPKEGTTDRVTIRYAHDPLDRTTTRTEDGKATGYTYLGLSAEVLTEELAGKLKKSYQYSPNGKRLSQVSHADDGSAETAQYGYNPHTDVETLTDDNGNTKATYGYTAFGSDDKESFTGIDKPQPQQPGKEPYNFYRFNGKRWDSTTGSYDMGFRDYNPGLNRFVSRDNYNGALSDLNLGLNPWTGNRYAFAGGNPVTGVELDGHGLCADDGCMYVCSAECSNEEAAELSNRMAADRKAADDAAREDRKKQNWIDEYQKAVDDVDKELLGTRRLLEDPNIPPDFLEAAHARVDERFCERLGGQDCPEAIGVVAAAAVVVGIEFPNGDRSAKRHESAKLVEDSVRRQLGRGWNDLIANHLNDKQRAAYAEDIKNKKWGPARRWLGTALHNAVAADLRQTHGGRFGYTATRDPDYYDRKNKVHVELTTRLGFLGHLARGGAYLRATYVLYRGPGRLPGPGGNIRMGGGQ